MYRADQDYTSIKPINNSKLCKKHRREIYCAGKTPRTIEDITAADPAVVTTDGNMD